MAESTCSSRGPPKKKPRSDVWEHYELVEGGKKVKCLLCNPPKEIAYHGGTTNLREHLASQHPLDYKKDAAKQTSLLDFSKRSRCSEARAKQITELITDMVILDMRPLRLVEGAGFLQLMNYLEPAYKVPSAMHISTLVRHKHEAARQKLKAILESKASNVSLTTDIWTSIATEAYVTVSGHFISPDWDMYSVVLTTCAFPERHTGIEISNSRRI